MAFDSKYFLSNLSRFKDNYSSWRLLAKIKRFGRKAGRKVVYAVLILYYASLDKSVPTKDRLMILAALGYFITPVDLLPDALPLGFSDDMAALTFVLKTVWSNISDDVFAKAKARLEDWFGPAEPSAPKIPGLG